VQTLLIYLVVLAAVVALLFALVWFVFGRSEDLPPLEPETTLTRLPAEGVTGHDIRALRFQLVARGYKQGEVDWALEKLAREIDELRDVVHRLQARDAGAGSDAGGPL